jgi:hypothetical protein
MGQNPASKGKKTHEGIHVKGILEFRDQPKNSRKKGQISWVPSFVSMETRTLPSRGVQAIGRSESLFRKEQGGFLGHFQGLATSLHGVGSVLENGRLARFRCLGSQGHIFWRTSSGKGRALHARKESITTTPTLPPFGPPAHRKRTGGNAMPRFESGLGMRTRRARPSEKTASRVVSGPSPARPS